jgi:hypothetical protein
MSVIFIKADYVTYFYSNILYALCLSTHIMSDNMSIIFMTMNYFDYFQLFHSNWNNWYNSTTSPCQSPCRAVPSTPFAFITYRGTNPMPMSWQTTSCIRLQNPADGRLALPESECASCGDWFHCRWLEQQAVFPGYFQLGWQRELVSCSLARIGHGNRQIPANLEFNEYNAYKTHYRYKWYYWNNYHSQDHRMFPVWTQVRIRRTWIQCQSQQMLKTAAKPEHTRLSLATQ